MSHATRATENQDYYRGLWCGPYQHQNSFPPPAPLHGGNEKGKAKYDYNPRCPHENANNYR